MTRRGSLPGTAPAAWIALLVLVAGAASQVAHAQTGEEDGPSVTVTLVDWEQRDQVSMALRVYDQAQGLGAVVGEMPDPDPAGLPQFPGPQPQIVVDRPGTYGVYVGQDTNTGGGAGTSQATVTFQYRADRSAAPAPPVTRRGLVGLDPSLAGGDYEYTVGYLFLPPGEGVVLLIDTAGRSVDLTTGNTAVLPEGVSIPGLATGALPLPPGTGEPAGQEQDAGTDTGEDAADDGQEGGEQGLWEAAPGDARESEGLGGLIVAIGLLLGVGAAVLLVRWLLGHSALRWQGRAQSRAAAEAGQAAQAARAWFRSEANRMLAPGEVVWVPNPEIVERARSEQTELPPGYDAPLPPSIQVLPFDPEQAGPVVRAEVQRETRVIWDPAFPDTAFVSTGADFAAIQVRPSQLSLLPEEFHPTHQLAEAIEYPGRHGVERLGPGDSVQVLTTTGDMTRIRVHSGHETWVPRGSIEWTTATAEAEFTPPTPPPPPPAPGA